MTNDGKVIYQINGKDYLPQGKDFNLEFDRVLEYDDILPSAKSHGAITCYSLKDVIQSFPDKFFEKRPTWSRVRWIDIEGKLISY